MPKPASLGPRAPPDCAIGNQLRRRQDINRTILFSSAHALRCICHTRQGGREQRPRQLTLGQTRQKGRPKTPSLSLTYIQRAIISKAGSERNLELRSGSPDSLQKTERRNYRSGDEETLFAGGRMRAGAAPAPSTTRVFCQRW